MSHLLSSPIGAKPFGKRIKSALLVYSHHHHHNFLRQPLYSPFHAHPLHRLLPFFAAILHVTSYNPPETNTPTHSLAMTPLATKRKSPEDDAFRTDEAKTPTGSPPKKKMKITRSQKQALMDNLQLESMFWLSLPLTCILYSDSGLSYRTSSQTPRTICPPGK